MRHKRRKGQLRLQSVVGVHRVARRQALVDFRNAQIAKPIVALGQEGINRTGPWILASRKDSMKCGAGGHHFVRILLFGAGDFEQQALQPRVLQAFQHVPTGVGVG